MTGGHVAVINWKSKGLAGGDDGTRTRDLMRDRNAGHSSHSPGSPTAPALTITYKLRAFGENRTETARIGQIVQTLP